MDLLNRLDLEITRKCKYKCGTCSVDAISNVPNSEISLVEIKQKVLEFKNLGGKEVSITGGEPTERGIDFLTNLIHFCKFSGLKIRMYSVGYGLQSNDDVHALKAAGLDCIIVTLAGRRHIDEIYKGVKGSFAVALRTIELCRKNSIEVVIHFTPTKMNFQELPHVVDIAHSFGVEKIRVMSFIAQGRGWTNRDFFQMNKSEEQKFGRIVQDLKIQNKIELQFSGPFDFEGENNQSCLIAKNRMVITSEGTMIPTFAVRMDRDSKLPLSSFSLGNVNDSSLEKAWQDPVLSTSRYQKKCGICPSCTE